MKTLHPRDILFYLQTHIDAGVVIGGTVIGATLLLTSGSITERKMRPVFYGGSVILAIAAKRGRAIFQRTEPMMTIARDESEIAHQNWIHQALNPSAETIDATIIEMKEIKPGNLDALGQKNTLIVGASGTGKSTIAKAVARRLGGRVTVLDPHHKKRDWGELPVIGGGRDFKAIDAYLAAQIEEMDHRYKMRNLGIEDFPMCSTIIDEAPAIAANCDNWRPYIRATAREARKVLLPAIILAQDENAKTLDIEGEAAMREGFDRLYLGTIAINKARSLKDAALLEWLKGCKRPGLFNEQPLEVPDLTGLTLEPFGALSAQEEGKQLSPAQVATESDREPAQETGLPESKPESLPTNEDEEYTLFLALEAHLKAGKSKSYIVQEILGCKGRKFKAGMNRLNGMIDRFGGEA
ncbi:type IV secretory system conjugative DNA transfer family protein [Microcoleus sp. FACHB-672]|uniref:type IV secretory system conjugative DNA transfer family protein n=1 Tax=Microcoleus sp. FACHB-672 TaxID=2692825 RepID=UPI001688EBBA|nr:type IV secretory system conjugative DNA transfer family protein [Microcoleus sp. FACHB-672]MBD2040183.1 hypothetical protein [Microcoleus sp. FACHB-672]